MDRETILRDIRERLDALGPEEARLRGRALFARAIGVPQIGAGRFVWCYLPAAGEPDPRELLERLLAAGRRVAVPRIRRGRIEHAEIQDLRALRPNSRGVLEPAPELSRPVKAAEASVVVVPGLAFGRDGARIGWPDDPWAALLAEASCPAVGVAYDLQVVDALEPRAGTSRVSTIVTESGVYGTGAPRPI